MSIERQGVLLMFSALTHKIFMWEKVTNKTHLAKFVLKNIWKNKL